MSLLDRLRRKRDRNKNQDKTAEDAWEDGIFDIVEDIGLATERTKEDIHAINVGMGEFRAHNEGMRKDIKRILRATVDRDPPLDTELTTQRAGSTANREKIKENREGLREMRDEMRGEIREVRTEMRNEVKGLDSRLDEVEKWQRSTDTHSGYTRKDLDKAERKRDGLDGRVRDEEKKSVKTSVQVGLLWAAAGAVGMSTLGLVIWALKALFGG